MLFRLLTILIIIQYGKLYQSYLLQVFESEHEEALDDISLQIPKRIVRSSSSQDPRNDGILLGLGLAKTGSTSLHSLFCKYKLLNTNCGKKNPEDKYWHDCVEKYFQSKDQTSIFIYDIEHILSRINDGSIRKCTVQGWLSTRYKKKSAIRRYVSRKNTSNSNNTMTSLISLKGYHAKTTNHFGSIYIPYILLNSMTTWGMNLKFYVMFRNPLSRILSSYIYMVGYEKKYIPERYGNINSFIRRDLNNQYLINIINILNDPTITNVWNLNWTLIFQQWILYEANTRNQCYKDKEYLSSIIDTIQKEKGNFRSVNTTIYSYTVTVARTYSL